MSNAEWVCIIAEFSNSTRTNSFHTVESWESSSYSTEGKHSSQGIVCLHSLFEFKHRKIKMSCQPKMVFHISESRNDT